MRIALHTFAAVFVLTLVCACQAPAEPPADTAAALPIGLPAPEPIEPSALAWRRLDTINNCHIYALRHEGRDYLLATAHYRTVGNAAVASSCSLVGAPQ